MRKTFEIGGFIAAAVLIVFGIGAIAMGVSARGTVNDTLKEEQIVGTPDMTPSAIEAEAKQAGLPAPDQLPTTSVAGEAIDTGTRAHAFAGVHADPRARGDRRADVRPDAALRHGRRQGHQRHRPGAEGERSAPGQRRAAGVGDGDRPRHGAPVQLHGQPAVPVRHRHRRRPAALGIGFAILAAGGALRNRENAVGGLLHRHDGKTADQAVTA